MLLKSELLDRMEILYPEHDVLSDLRRAYIDRDANSMFRLYEYFYNDDIVKLRKAFRDDNFHVLFHLLDREWVPEFHQRPSPFMEEGDLKKFMMNDNVWSLFRILLDIQECQFLKAVKSFYASGVRIDKDALSQGQLKSKMWLLTELQALDLELGTVFLCAGWYGILAMLLLEREFNVQKIRSFDIDPEVEDIANKFNLPWLMDDWRFKAATLDIHDIDFEDFKYNVRRSDGSVCELRDRPDTIINTSCEHIERFDEWYAKIPGGKLVILQSNDYEDVIEHVNTSPDLDSFANQTPMAEVLFSGQMDLGAYNRFMRIGYR